MLEASQCSAELLESREQESSARMNAVSTENSHLKTKIAVCWCSFMPVAHLQ